MTISQITWAPLVLTIAVLAGGLASADEHEHEHRQHGRHEHGVGQLNVALEGEVLYIEWISPAVNIVGFEHKPSSHEQEETVRQALETLRDGQRLFSPTPEAGCRLAEAGVETDILAGESGHSHETHEHDKADHEAGEHHAAEGEAHAEFHATYRFACEQPGRLRELDVQVFSLFPGTEALEAQAVSERGQTAVDLSPSSTRLGF